MPKTLNFATDIPLFGALDVDHVSWFCDLLNDDDVKANADDILNRLKGIGGAVVPSLRSTRSGNGLWTSDKIDLFAARIDAGYPAGSNPVRNIARGDPR